jgi:hypothetical protein
MGGKEIPTLTLTLAIVGIGINIMNVNSIVPQNIFFILQPPTNMISFVSHNLFLHPATSSTIPSTSATPSFFIKSFWNINQILLLYDDFKLKNIIWWNSK